jgi:hypothetical protein
MTYGPIKPAEVITALLLALDPADPQAQQFLAQVRAGAQRDPGR